MNEFIRKQIVALKRAPKIIPIVFMFITFLVYSMNLTTFSDATATANVAGMGLSEFCIMLFSLLSMVCVLNAFPHRKKPVVPMIVLLFVIMAIIVFCDVYYINALSKSTAEAYRTYTVIEGGETKTIAVNLSASYDNAPTLSIAGMGLTIFCVMLFSLILVACVLHAMPGRQKPAMAVVVLLFMVMTGIVICYIFGMNALQKSTDEAMRVYTLVEGGVVKTVTGKNEFILNAPIILTVHIVMEIISAILVATLPLYAKLIRKINTSVAVEDNGAMDAIELED